MATIRVPAEVPSPAQDSEAINHAFRGTLRSINPCIRVVSRNQIDGFSFLKFGVGNVYRMGNRWESDYTRFREKKREPEKENQRKLQRDLRQRSYRCSHLWTVWSFLGTLTFFKEILVFSKHIDERFGDFRVFFSIHEYRRKLWFNGLMIQQRETQDSQTRFSRRKRKA